MFQKLKKYIYSSSRLRKEILFLQSCDPNLLPLLIIDDHSVRIETHRQTFCPTINYISKGGAGMMSYAADITKMKCNQAVVFVRIDDYMPKNAPKGYEPFNTDVPGVIGLQFWHDDGNQYIYWAVIQNEYRNRPDFGGLVFDGLARQGLDRRTVDNFRIDYRAGRIQQHNLPLK